MNISRLVYSVVPKSARLVQLTVSVVRSGKTFLRPEKPSVAQNLKYSTEQAGKAAEPVKLSSREKVKRAALEYGPIFIAFHITISLTSLGMWYLLVRQVGANKIEELMVNVGLSKDSMLASLGTFGVAYAGHKSIAPVRIGISLFFVPMIVRVLKNKGFMKYVNGKLVFAYTKPRRMR